MLVLTRSGCHLCEVAIEVVAEVCAELGTGYTTQDIDTDPELLRRYTDEVPVVIFDDMSSMLDDSDY